MIYVSITTTGDWKSQIKEVKELGLKQVCLFLTCLDKKARKKLYSLLEKTKVDNIPLVHIRGDMDSDELNLIKTKYNSQVFNIHPPREYPIVCNIDEYRDMTYIENLVSWDLDEDELNNFAGICLDISHLEDRKRENMESYNKEMAMINSHTIGCNHISAMKHEMITDSSSDKRYSSHILEDFSEMDYLKDYKEYFSPIMALELENSIKDQLKIKEYVCNKFKGA